MRCASLFRVRVHVRVRVRLEYGNETRSELGHGLGHGHEKKGDTYVRYSPHSKRARRH